MTVGVVTVRHDGSLMLNKLLHGHVSRVRAIHSQGSYRSWYKLSLLLPAKKVKLDLKCQYVWGRSIRQGLN